ncbi:hypothetical protein [Kineococcus radiotolerans]|uniref:Uncharacterized protein n=1 Tax=Kineococcus radiotolerans (strain ATCC BAA-149 / DSM 14245 / SRS30216) TaxID=266940 RepID=A6W8R4_KINRD|nr:hypothetical protein [Kineococcus radiotolerans]ABS03203.1 hypothetical protein Krad_1717 [Kineococcus radiotolerans SRS30216 = ATCC BAA-149]
MIGQHALTVRVLRPITRDNDGDETPGDEHDEPGCIFAPATLGGADTEPGDFANTVISGGMLFCPGRTLDVNPSDRVVVRGLVYDVQGELGDWGPAGSQVALRRTVG